MILTEENKKNIIDTIKTKKRSMDLIRDSQKLLDKYYMSSDVSFDKHCRELNAKYDNLLSLCLNGIQERDTVLECLKELIDFLRNTTSVDVNLAFRPNNDFIITLYTWLKSNIKPMSLLNITVNESILGGIQLTLNGHFIDLSLQKRLDTYLDLHKADVLSKL